MAVHRVIVQKKNYELMLDEAGASEIMDATGRTDLKPDEVEINLYFSDDASLKKVLDLFYKVGWHRGEAAVRPMIG